MKKEKNNKTEALLLEAFGSLIAKKHLEDISVVDIIKKADIYRSTFYTHYDSKYDLASAYILNCMDGINDIQMDILNESHAVRLDAATRYFKLFKENADLIYYAISHLGEQLTFNSVEQGISDMFNNLMAADAIPDTDNKEIFRQYLIGALVGITKWYIHSGMKIAPEAIAKLYCENYILLTKNF